LVEITKILFHENSENGFYRTQLKTIKLNAQNI